MTNDKIFDEIGCPDELRNVRKKSNDIKST